MAYDEELAGRIRTALGKRHGLSEKKMFGGLAFLLNGNMCCGVHKDELILRLDPAESEAALRQKHVRVFDLTGRPMKGWLLVGTEGMKTAPALAKWVTLGADYAATLPKK